MGAVVLRVAVVDCLARGRVGRRVATVDAIGAGPRLVVGIAESLGHRADLLMCEEAVKKPSALKGYEVLMVSGMSVDVPSMVKVVRRWGRGPSVAGGPAFVDYDSLLRGGFDYVVWGEGEAPIPDLLKHLDLGTEPTGVPNLIYRGEGGRVVRNPGPLYLNHPPLWMYRPSVRAVTNYPGWWGARVYVEVVRGCSNFLRPTLRLPNGRACIKCDNCRSPNLEVRLQCPIGIPPGCGYCSVPALFGPARSRPLEDVVWEVRGLIKAGVTRVVLSAPDFLDYGRDWLVAPKPLTNPREPPPNLGAIESLLKEVTSIPEVSSGDAYVMVENVKPNLVSREVAEALGRYLRGTPIHIGLESGDREHHTALGRPSTVDEVVEAVKLLRSAGLKPYIYVIHGLPGESRRTVKATARVVKELFSLGVEKVTLYRFTPLKGTAFEGFKPPPPAVKSLRARSLYWLVRRLNLEGKRRLVGATVKAVVAGAARDGLVAYTLPHGPVVKVPGGRGLMGKVVEVRVTEAVSDRVVRGDVIRVLRSVLGG